MIPNRLLERKPATVADLIANPDNWREHPEKQRQQLREMMETVGLLSFPLINQTTGRLIDGHARVLLADEAGQDTIEADYCELSEAEEALALAVLDASTALAVKDAQRFDALAERMSALTPALADLFEQLKTRRPEAVNLEVQTYNYTTVHMTFGAQRVTVPIAVFVAWEADLRKKVGLNNQDILAEIRKRLQL